MLLDELSTRSLYMVSPLFFFLSPMIFSYIWSFVLLKIKNYYIFMIYFIIKQFKYNL
jgi:hypothetical protein